MKEAKILVIDDEKKLRDLIKEILNTAGFKNVITAKDANEAYGVLNSIKPDLILLDVMMPEIDGIKILKEIRKVSNTPIIILSAKGELEDKYTGFENGADDYIIKPFFMKELIYRVEALLKRTLKNKKTLKLTSSEIDLDQAVVIKEKERINLTAKEYQILMKLYENEGRIVSIASLCQTLIGDYWIGYENTLMSHIRNLRKKIEEDPSKPKHLITIRGLGYKLVVDNE